MKPKALLRRPIVLAVDDVPANLVALEAVLSGECNLILAHSGDEAIAVLKSRSDIDVILMDLQMPQKDGFETAAEIKKLEGCEDIPIIFITAIYKEEPFVRKGYQVGAVDYFSKPFDPEILKMKVSVYASLRQRTDFLDARERQINETEALLEAGRKLSSTLESLPVGVLISDTEGRICQTNTEVARIFKVSEPTSPSTYGELLGWWESEGQRIKNGHGPLYRALHNGETSHNEKLNIRCLDGTKKEIRCSASPLLDSEGELIGAVVVIQDISESKVVEKALEERIAKFVSLGVELEHTAQNSHGPKAGQAQ
jgi:response regulator RpfG family c-di-GMP phosphodiesterase